MAVLGVCVVPSGATPKLTGVVADGTLAAPVLLDEFQTRTNATEPSEQAVDLARLLLAKLPAIEFSSAAIRIAGTSPVARRNKAIFSRAHAEGAVLFVLREHLKLPVALGDPKALAKACGSTQAALEAAVNALLDRNSDAGYAALSQLPAT